jgi:hypothetical protein
VDCSAALVTALAAIGSSNKGRDLFIAPGSVGGLVGGSEALLSAALVFACFAQPLERVETQPQP